MTDRELEEKLRLAADHAAPDRVEEVLSRCDGQKGTVIEMKRNGNAAKRWLAAAACLAVLMAGGGGLVWQQANAVASVVSLDVNPSIELRVNKNQKVISCTALNEDAREVLSGMAGGADLKGAKADVAVNALVGALVRSGYLEDVSSAILISVEDPDARRGQALEQQLTQAVSGVFADSAAAPRVTGQTVEQNEELARLARDNNISGGKAALVEQVRKQSGGLRFEALAALSVEELEDMRETGEQRMPLGKSAALAAALAYAGAPADYEIDAEVDPELDERPPCYEVEFRHAVLGEVEYRVDAFTGQILSGEKDAMKNAPSNPDQISRQQAEDAALAHAGVKRSDVTAIFAKKDMERGVLLWEVEFYAGGQEYDYELNAVTGEILSHEQEQDDEGVIGGADGATAIVTQDMISEEQAVEAALNHAGVTRAQVTGLEADYDRTDGIWEVEFESGGMEYEYEISGVNGLVLQFEREQA